MYSRWMPPECSTELYLDNFFDDMDSNQIKV